jgi:hypothetical protein
MKNEREGNARERRLQKLLSVLPELAGPLFVTVKAALQCVRAPSNVS